jgi:hypothetical protein
MIQRIVTSNMVNRRNANFARAITSSRTKGLEMSEELEFAGLVVGEKFCITLDNDFVEIEVDDPAEGIAISIKRADAIALAHAILRRYPDLD